MDTLSKTNSTSARVVRKSILGQITWSLFIICISIFAITELFILFQYHDSLWESVDHDLKTRAEFLTSLVDIEDGAFDYDEEDVSSPDYSLESPTAYFLILSADDRTEIARSPSLNGLDISTDDLTYSVKTGKPAYRIAEINKHTTRFIALKQVIQFDDEDDEDDDDEDEEDEETGDLEMSTENDDIDELNDDKDQDDDEVFGLFIVGVHTEPTEARFWNMLRLTCIALGSGLILLLMIGRYILRRKLDLLNRFRDEVHEISSQNLKPVTVPEVSEIASVADTLNTVVMELDRVFKRERQFTSNVAHELRTPISEIRSMAEVALQYGDSLDQETSENYQDVLDSSIHLQSILENLLILSRFDSAQLKTKPSSFNLVELLSGVINRVKHRADEHNLAFNADFPGECLIFTDDHMLQTVMDNLVNNAVSYSPDNSCIQVVLSADLTRFCISITNSSHGLTQEDIPNVFDRFWRKEQVRSTEDSHSGLGLPIARALLENLGFEIDIQLTSDNKFKVVVTGDRGPVSP